MISCAILLVLHCILTQDFVSFFGIFSHCLISINFNYDYPALAWGFRLKFLFFIDLIGLTLKF